jgi:hypothetical protein
MVTLEMQTTAMIQLMLISRLHRVITEDKKSIAACTTSSKQQQVGLMESMEQLDPM